MNENLLMCIDDRQVKPFWMVGLHTRPTNTICELQRLEDVYKKGFPQSPSPLRVVFLGDFNADCTYFKEYDEKKIPFLFDPNSAGMKMLPFKKDARTNVIGDQKCIYDRIVVSNSMLSEVQGQAEVGSFFVPKNKNVCCILYMPCHITALYAFWGLGLWLTA